jgi:mono/diheme cytochrome c family protein
MMNGWEEDASGEERATSGGGNGGGWKKWQQTVVASVSAVDRMQKILWFLILMVLVGVQPGWAAKPTPKRAQADLSSMPAALKRPIRYFGDIHPILAEHCVGCHGPDKQKGSLRLDSREAALAGGGSYGPAIVPGNPAESPLLLFTAHFEPELEMPPDEERLGDHQLALLRTWIEQGAVWPAMSKEAGEGGETLGNQELYFKKAETHWAFQPIPKASEAELSGVSERIDGLVEQARAKQELAGSPPADPRTLLRRLHFDTTGLPPTLEELQAFLVAYEKDADKATREVVDRLLAAPGFGERWARYWLDIARYADTSDFVAQADLRYPFAWTYRDYVVRAFNGDKPYDQFVMEQIAADQLELGEQHADLAALGFFTVGPRFRRRTEEIINDRIDVVTRGLMGMTVACARCHDHKYDPIPTADFYSLYGVFASTEEPAEWPEIQLPTQQVDPMQRKGYEEKLAVAKQGLDDFIQKLKREAVADVLKKPELYFDALVKMEVERSADVRKLITGKSMLQTALTPLSNRYGKIGREGWGEDPILGPLAQVAGAPKAQKARLIGTMLETGKLPGSETAIQAALLKAMRQGKVKDEAGLLRAYGALLAGGGKKPTGAVAAVGEALKKRGSLLDFSDREVEAAHRLLGSGRAELNKLRTAITEVDATHPGAPPRAMALAEAAKPVTPVIFVRGDANRKGDAVPRRFLQVLDPSQTPYPADRSGRLELAKQIVDRGNPLTARVWANQIWRHLMGRPLAESVSDFGLQAAAPSHPELLDLLASALADRQWSTKQLIRDVLLSRSYQQSSVIPAGAVGLEKDPENRLYWRANRRRMDFEAMRDAMLATSGQLDLTQGGRAVDLSAEPFSGRRTLYGHIDRVNLDPLFTTFDFPSPDIASPERSQTLVPQQALFALNDSFIMSQARALAKRAAQEVEGPQELVRRLYQRVFLREPSKAEAVLASHFLRTTNTQQKQAQTQGVWQYGYGSPDPAVPRQEAFTPLPHYDAATKRYQASRVFPMPGSELSHASLSAVGGHPAKRPQLASVRRWLAPFDGVIRIGGEVGLVRQGGDGIRARILSSRHGQLGEWITLEKPAATVIESVTVKRGDILDFAVDCYVNPNSDAYRWAPSIAYQVKPEDTPATLQTLWDAQADFAGPPPAKLRPVEQIAHALLMTNEFFFVD